MAYYSKEVVVSIIVLIFLVLVFSFAFIAILFPFLANCFRIKKKTQDENIEDSEFDSKMEINPQKNVFEEETKPTKNVLEE